MILAIANDLAQFLSTIVAIVCILGLAFVFYFRRFANSVEKWVNWQTRQGSRNEKSGSTEGPETGRKQA